MGWYMSGGGGPPEPELAAAYLAALDRFCELAANLVPLSGVGQVFCESEVGLQDLGLASLHAMEKQRQLLSHCVWLQMYM